MSSAISRPQTESGRGGQSTLLLRRSLIADLSVGKKTVCATPFVSDPTDDEATEAPEQAFTVAIVAAGRGGYPEHCRYGADPTRPGAAPGVLVAFPPERDS